MRAAALILTGASLIAVSQVTSGVDIGEISSWGSAKGKSTLQHVNKTLANQQVKDGQFEFKTGKADFAPGNEKRVKGLLKVIMENSNKLKKVFPKLKVVAEGHTDSAGNADSNMKLSRARAETVCRELKAKGMSVPCVAKGVGSSKPLVAREKTEADRQKNRRVLVQVTG